MRRVSGGTLAIKAKASRDGVYVVIEDDGVGIAPESLGGVHSLGLVGMRERAVACGGTLKIRCEPGRGTLVVVEIPVTQA